MVRSDPQRDGAANSAAPSALAAGKARPGPARRGGVGLSVREMFWFASITFLTVLVIFTRSARLQLLDERARYCTDSSGRAWALIVDPMVYLTIGSLGVCLIVSMFVALMRRRFALAVAALLVVAGANITTQLLKSYWSTRPHLWDNSLPSGHATAAMSIAIAALLVVSPGWRQYVVAASAFIATFVGAGTIVGHWHRPADVVAAFLNCLMWTVIAIGMTQKWQRRGRSLRASIQPRLPVAGASLAGLVFILAGVRPLEHKIKWVEAGFTFGTIGLLSALVLTWVAAAADEQLG